ncbi:Aste57867_25360 [Aphanomyces stellatus]|uniref:Aste57867_25360 protein n=1 Tax=Aphanomyces stellatus TaxID=120398 RepID=A0A485LSZ8_9STRA|nr:hypothetical protein As57867_025282 [Aphanomyces stellatus]VFU01985.1 Aste57867_25360 [Aphanomyces stellatus]
MCGGRVSQIVSLPWTDDTSTRMSHVPTSSRLQPASKYRGPIGGTTPPGKSYETRLAFGMVCTPRYDLPVIDGAKEACAGCVLFALLVASLLHQQLWSLLARVTRHHNCSVFSMCTNVATDLMLFAHWCQRHHRQAEDHKLLPSSPAIGAVVAVVTCSTLPTAPPFGHDCSTTNRMA